MSDLRLILVDPNVALGMAWARAFAELPNVDIQVTTFQNVRDPWDAIVAPGNSFGIMDGGLDLAIRDYYAARDCPYLQDRVQRAIRNLHNGEQAVGTCCVIDPLGGLPFVAYAPTMRIPMDIRGTENVYLAMKAALEAISRANAYNDRQIASVIVPGLGMGTGRVPYEVGAQQMAVAYQHWLQPPPERITWADAAAWHSRIRSVS